MSEIVVRYTRLFKGVGRAQIDPIHIFIDEKVKLVKHKQQKVDLHFMEGLRHT